MSSTNGRPEELGNHQGRLKGHDRRRHWLRQLSLERARTAPPLAHALVELRARALGLTRLEFARRSGIPRGTLRDLELGLHWPTRRVLRQFLVFCESQGVAAPQLEELRAIYAGAGNSLGQFLARSEGGAGSARALARQAGISPATLWEYHRGNYPLPWELLQRLCRAVGADPAPGEAAWHDVERQRLVARGYPEALADFWTHCAREGYAEKHLLARGLSTPAARRLRYLDLPPWAEVEELARLLCRNDDELKQLRALWARDERTQRGQPRDRFGPQLQELRKRRGMSRRELADLFNVGGKKPARIIKTIEEDGLYSAQAFPAGLAAIVAPEPGKREELLKLWRARRELFHRRRRPETRTELRLARELYGFDLGEMEPILGYTRLEYERLERGVGPLTDSARQRIVDAIHLAGKRRIVGLLERQRQRELKGRAWQAPLSVADLISLLSQREGGLLPLRRYLRGRGVTGLGLQRLREIAAGKRVPAWPVLARLANACGVEEFIGVLQDWRSQYRKRLEVDGRSPLGVELRLLISEKAATARAFSAQLGLHSSLLIRDLQRFDRDEPVRWSRVERILRAVGLPVGGSQWQEIRSLWSTAAERFARHPR